MRSMPVGGCFYWCSVETCECNRTKWKDSECPRKSKTVELETIEEQGTIGDCVDNTYTL